MKAVENKYIFKAMNCINVEERIKSLENKQCQILENQSKDGIEYSINKR